MLVSVTPGADFSRGCVGRESATYFSRPTPAFPRFAICSRWYCVDLAEFCTITGNIKLLKLKGSWEEGATIDAADLADPGNKKPRRRVMSEERLRLTAYHEAGHAVASWVMGLEMEGASIEPQGSSLGRVSFAEMEAMEVYDEIMHRYLVSYYAGVKAVELYTGRPTDPDDPNMDPRYQGSDWDGVMDLTVALGGPEESGQAAVQEQAKEKAQRILRENWRGVEVVAEALLRHRSLDSADLPRILVEANCLRGKPVYEYEQNKLSERLGELGNQYNALLEEGHQEEAQRVAAEYAQVKSKMEDLARLYEGYDDQLHY